MGTTKSDIFTNEQNEVANLAKSIGHPARIAILQYLVQKNACVCGDIVDEIGLAQATVSQHLKELKNSGIIKGNVEGRNVCYCIDENKWKEVSNLFSDLFKLYTNDKCC